MKRSKKNISHSVGNGATLQTRDEFVGSSGFKKPGFSNRGSYRRVVVVDSNKDDELAVVKLQGNNGDPRRIPLNKYRNGHSAYRPFVYTNDNGNPIKVGGHYKRNPKSYSVSSGDVIEVKKFCFSSTSTPKFLRKQNRSLLRKLKKRP